MSFEIIDFHMHPYVTEEENSCLAHYAPVTKTDEIAPDLARCGITKFAGSVIERVDGTSFEPILRMNDHAYALRDRFAGAYIPGVHIHPNFVEESIREIKRAKENGVVLIGELVPYMMGWTDFCHENAMALYDYAQSLGMVVSAHSSGNWADMEKLAAAFPNLQIVYAHPGQRKDCAMHVELMKKYANVSLDISGTGLFRYGILAYLAKEVGAHRVLFGTDYPICNPAMQVAGVMYEDLTDAQREMIFSGNAKRLLNLK